MSATNIYGTSEVSVVGSGATIISVPDSPEALAEDAAERTGSTLGLVWTDGVDNGGTTIIDYRISVTSSDGLYNVVTSHQTGRSYVAVGLTKGVTYYFKVQARNAHGYSL